MRTVSLVGFWLLLMVLLGIEFAVAKLHGGSLAAPFFGLGMAVLVAMTFMRLPGAPTLAAVFVMAGMFWLAVLIGLGGLDPATRHDIPVSMPKPP
jgi:cytochrome c oxidase subunit IV